VPKVAAYVSALHVTDNSPFSTGQLLVELDPRDFEAALTRTGHVGRNDRHNKDASSLAGLVALIDGKLLVLSVNQLRSTYNMP
jgi:multidrug resistance efflux pump